MVIYKVEENIFDFTYIKYIINEIFSKPNKFHSLNLSKIKPIIFNIIIIKNINFINSYYIRNYNE